MKTTITAGLTSEKKEELVSSFNASAVLRERIKELLRKKIDTNNKTTRSKDSYNIANWSYLQADAVGYERALEEVCALLE